MSLKKIFIAGCVGAILFLTACRSADLRSPCPHFGAYCFKHQMPVSNLTFTI